jgi:hypothetical protein
MEGNANAVETYPGHHLGLSELEKTCSLMIYGLWTLDEKQDDQGEVKVVGFP